MAEIYFVVVVFVDVVVVLDVVILVCGGVSMRDERGGVGAKT